MRRLALGLCITLALGSWIAACGGEAESLFLGPGATDDPGSEPVPPTWAVRDDDASTPGDDADIDCDASPDLCAPTGVCGDGIVNPGEACDDGNDEGGDGCSFDCTEIEPNFACPTPGKACVSTMECGDGKITGTEQCDDGNKKSGDGCSSTCQLEPGWSCLTPGTVCTATACGDGKLAGTEQCDDGNTKSGDGCSSTCQLETKSTTTAPTSTAPGKTVITHYKCPTPGQACMATVCGNGMREGSEQCDDGNTKAFDGCSPTCELEPNCPNGKCVAVCGDGILFDFDANGDGKNDEACDDGNTLDGDGCSSTCQVEPGYTCTAQNEASPSFLDLPVTIRDFKYYKAGDSSTHPDFEHYWAASTAASPKNHPGTTALVKSTLSTGKWGVPQFNRSFDSTQVNDQMQITSAASFSDWYQDIKVGGVQRGMRIDDLSLRLTKDAAGAYVFNSKTDDPYKTKGLRYPLTNGTGLFLPIDGMGWGNQLAGPDNGQDTTSNFAFTTELRYWFTYDKNTAPTLTFSGDDDVWVFVNGTLALDLGGLHGVLSDSFTLDAAKAAQLGLKDKNLYEIALFHAERRSYGSNFWLTLKGFTKKHSVCSETCGDGVKTASEQCDKGAANTNDGAYGSCTKQCKLGPYCGDKTVTTPPEQCDDGVNLTSWTPTASSTVCAPGCVKPAFCGDGAVQGAFGEQCDNGTANNTGAYGGCKANCTLGPRCGDGIVQAGEECDDGNRVNGDGCSATCTKEGPK